MTTWTNFINWLGELLESSFLLLEAGGNMVNLLISLMGVAYFLYWMKEQSRYNKEADNGNGIK